MERVREIRLFIHSLPPRELSPNARVHWRVKYSVAEAWKTLVWVAIQEWMQTYGTLDPSQFPIPKARIDYIFQTATRHKRDPDNYVAMMKPALDMLVQMGILAGDDGEHLTLGDVKFVVGVEPAPATIIVLRPDEVEG